MYSEKERDRIVSCPIHSPSGRAFRTVRKGTECASRLPRQLRKGYPNTVHSGFNSSIFRRDVSIPFTLGYLNDQRMQGVRYLAMTFSGITRQTNSSLHRTFRVAGGTNPLEKYYGSGPHMFFVDCQRVAQSPTPSPSVDVPRSHLSSQLTLRRVRPTVRVGQRFDVALGSKGSR